MDLIDLLGVRWRGMPWTRCILRKDATCWACGDALVKGGDAFRPLSNSANRYRRICTNCALLAAKGRSLDGPAAD